MIGKADILMEGREDGERERGRERERESKDREFMVDGGDLLR